MIDTRPGYKLLGIFIRPKFGRKEIIGNLSIHINGLHYYSVDNDQVLVIMFNNIKHIFFQPSENDDQMIVILHLHLKNLVKFGERESITNIQFIKKVTNIKNVKADELHSCITADVFRNVRFLGTQFRRRILLQPTTNCLVHLVNYLQPPTHINTIPIYQLKVVKEWLDSIKIVYYEITPNLNWAQILRSINQDVEGFHKDCGWSFLDIYENDDDSEAKIDSDTDPGEASDESALDLDELEEGALN
ncbi:15269_t:CDS:2, partial [Entrophospora sp. SA101]